MKKPLFFLSEINCTKCVENVILLSVAGGSLDVYKSVPEHVLGRIALAVSFHQRLKISPLVV